MFALGCCLLKACHAFSIRWEFHRPLTGEISSLQHNEHTKIIIK